MPLPFLVHGNQRVMFTACLDLVHLVDAVRQIGKLAASEDDVVVVGFSNGTSKALTWKVFHALVNKHN